jgi:hypothetical protein
MAGKPSLSDDERLVADLRAIPDVFFPTGHQHLMVIVENQQLIARGIAKLIERPNSLGVWP